VAGAAMAGRNFEYLGTVISNTLKLVGLDLFSAGEIDVQGTLDSMVIKDEAKNISKDGHPK
jgi:nitrite reductase (NADH) large subunit